MNNHTASAYDDMHGTTMAELTGTEKQVAWAVKIRDEHVTRVARLSKSCQDSGSETASNAKLLVELTGKAVEEIADAKWWIDNRDELATALLERHRLAGVAFAALEGSEKQVAWAEDIRSKVYAAVEAVAKETVAANEAVASAEDLATAKENIERALETLRSETSAKWWIDNRRMEFRPMGLLVELGRAAQ